MKTDSLIGSPRNESLIARRAHNPDLSRDEGSLRERPASATKANLFYFCRAHNPDLSRDEETLRERPASATK